MQNQNRPEIMVRILTANGYGSHDLQELGKYLNSKEFAMRVIKPASKFEKQVERVLSRMKFTGTQVMYLREAIKLMLENGNDMSIGVIYEKLANQFDMAGSTIERQIRLSIETIWKTADKKVLEEYLGEGVTNQTRRPKNSVFITRIANKLLAENL